MNVKNIWICEKHKIMWSDSDYGKECPLCAASEKTLNKKCSIHKIVWEQKHNDDECPLCKYEKYIEARHRTISSSVVAEELAGNAVKLQCEKTALAEIEALQQELLR